MKNPAGMCMCGCGATAPLSSVSRRGYERGEPLMFIKGHSTRKPFEYEVDPDTGCWLWIKYRDPIHGYGRAWDGSKVRSAHVVMYERLVGDVPEGHELHHRCGTRACCNPEHLVPMTRREHMLTEGRRPFGNPRLFVKDATP